MKLQPRASRCYAGDKRPKSEYRRYRDEHSARASFETSLFGALSESLLGGNTHTSQTFV
jgi:hypothetical protein